jgi:multidrug efflux system membrane fusion protein
MKKSYILSILIAVSIVGWFASGHIMPANGNNDTQPSEPIETANQSKPFRVTTKVFEATERKTAFPVRGLTEASRQVEVRSRTQGIVTAQQLDDGDDVTEGTVLCQLDIGDRRAQIARQRAQLASARRDFEASVELAESNYAAKSKVAADKARLEQARAELEQVELDMSWTRIAAPVDGVLRGKPAQAGAYLQKGDLCATLSVMNPILVVADVPERLLPNLKEGMTATASLVTGEEVSGVISQIAMASNRETRTFRVEMSVDNPDYALRDGITAQLNIPLPTVMAHKVPASALTLADNGKIGVRVVDETDKVSFVPLTILSQGGDGAWVSGLPNKATVIVEGQDFVIAGQTVDPVPERAEVN